VETTGVHGALLTDAPVLSTSKVPLAIKVTSNGWEDPVTNVQKNYSELVSLLYGGGAWPYLKYYPQASLKDGFYGGQATVDPDGYYGGYVAVESIDWQERTRSGLLKVVLTVVDVTLKSPWKQYTLRSADWEQINDTDWQNTVFVDDMPYVEFAQNNWPNDDWVLSMRNGPYVGTEACTVELEARQHGRAMRTIIETDGGHFSAMAEHQLYVPGNYDVGAELLAQSFPSNPDMAYKDLVRAFRGDKFVDVSRFRRNKFKPTSASHSYKLIVRGFNPTTCLTRFYIRTRKV